MIFVKSTGWENRGQIAWSNDLVYALALGIQSPSENGSMEPKYYAFRRWLDTPIIIWRGDWIPRVEEKLSGQMK